MATKRSTATKPVLAQDPLVDKLRPDPSQPPSIERRGFLGKSEKEGYWRVYLTRALADYVEIAETDIVYRESLATADDADAGSRVWIKEDAILTWGPPRQVQARNLERAISAGGESGAMAPRVDLATSLFMVPILPWAVAAHFWSAVFKLLERGLTGASSMAGADVTSDRYLSGRYDKVIRLGPRDYKVIPPAR